MSTQRIQKRESNISSATTSAIKRIQKHGNGSKLRRHEQVEKALRESEEKFRNLFDNARDMIVLVDTETGIILDINTAGCNLLGLPKEKIIGRHQSELHPPELADTYKRLFQGHVQRGGVINDYVIVQRANGAQIPMDVSASAVKLADKTIIQGIFRDVTERARIEKALQESEEKFSKAFRASPEAIGIVTEKDGKFIDVNESYVRMTGYSREELIGTTTNTHNWVRPEDHTKMQKMMQEQGRIYNEEFDYRTKSGEIRTRLFSIETITINGELCRIGVSTDITERKRAEEALQKERSFLSSVLTSIQDGITVLDNKLNIISVNKTAEKWFAHGMPLIGKKCYEACHNRSKPCEACPTMQTLETGKAANGVVPRHGPDGMITGWSELYTFPIFDTQKGEITGIIEYGRDITARKQAEEALRESEEKFSKAFHALPEQVSIVRIKDNVFVDVNESFCRNNGYTREEVVGHKGEGLNFLIKPSQWDQIRKIVKERGRAENIEFEFRDESGKTRTQLFSTDVINLGGEPCLLTIGKDISKLKQMEKTLRESEEKFSNAFHNLPEQVTIARVKDNVFVDVNESFCRYNGYTREEVIGRKREELNLLIGSSQRDQFTKILKEQGRAENIELECRDKSGETRTLLFSADIINLGGEPCQLTIANDITERKQIEQALKESEEKFSKAFQSSPDAVSLITVEGEKYIDINDSYTKMTGYSWEELIGNNAFSIDLWVNDENHNKMHKMMREQGRIYNEEFDYRTKSGEIRTRLFSLEPITINGEPCTIGVSTDITGRKRMEQALKESEEKFSKAFQAIPEVVTLVRMKDGVFVDVNETFCRNNGYTREEVIGRKGEDLNLPIKPSQWDKVRKMVKERGRAENIELEFREKSGESHAMLFSADIINLGGEPCLLTIGKDITERKRMEQALRESEEKFSKAFQASPEAIAITTVKDDKFIDVNESYIQITGYSREELIGNTSTSVHIWPNPDVHTKTLKKMQEQGKIYNEEFDYRTKSGEIRTRLISLEPITINGEPCKIGFSIDITERKRMEQAIKESEEKFSKAFRAMPEEVTINKMKDGVFIDVNESFCRNNGCTREEVIGRKAEELNLAIKPRQWDQIRKMVKERGRAEDVELEFRDDSGETHTLLFSADTINLGGEPCLLTIGNDISHRKQMEQALRESEEKFSKAFHAMPEEVTIARMNDNIFIDVNESFCRNNGCTREEVIGHKGEELNLLLGPSQRDQIIKMVKERGRAENTELEFRDKSGEIHTLLFSADTINLGGEPCILTIATNISQLKQTERKLKEALTNLELSSAKLKAINKELESFSYSVSHDLRSPLRSIDGFSQALLEDYSAKLDEKGQDYLNRLRNASQKMGELIDGILKLSRLTRSEMHHEKVNLSSLANEIAARLQETHDKRDVKFIIGSDLTATGDPQMLRVLLENLLGNAWKFTKNTKQTRIEFGSITEGERKTFFIKDNGAGFDMAFKDKLFGAFQRLHDAAEFPGTGIGLATVQRIINRHGGSIRAEGAVGTGATFYFTLN